MILSKADLPDIKWSMIALLISLVVSGSLVSISGKFEERALKDRQAAQKQLNDARDQLGTAENDQENMASYAMEYNALVAQKVIGDEQRLDWMEGLEKLRQQGVARDFTYTISPQHAYAPSPPLDAGNFQLNRSDMSMQIDLLHEEQLLRLFGGMHAQMAGWFILDGCTLSRAEAANEFSTLKAECSGGWFTMKNKNAP